MTEDQSGVLPRDFVGYGARPPKGTWPGGAKVALNVVVNIEEGSERSFPAGDNRNEGLTEVPRRLDPGYRDLAAESTYEYGSRVGIHRLLRLFGTVGIDATMFAAAQALEVNPDVAALLRDSDHEVCAHGYRWAEAWTMTIDEERTAIADAVASIERTCGRRPVGWYGRYMPSLHTRRLLVEEGGFRYDADAYNDDIPYYTKVGTVEHLVVPYSMTYNDSFYSYGQLGSPTDFLDYCVRGLDYLRQEPDGVPRLMSVGLHPRISGQAARSSAVKEFLEYAVATADVWITTRNEIAQFWLAEHPPGAVRG